MKVLTNLHFHLPFAPATLLLGMLPKEMCMKCLVITETVNNLEGVVGGTTHMSTQWSMQL